MSMSVLVAKFDLVDNKLDANYEDLSKRVKVTEYINKLIGEDLLSEFEVFNGTTKYIYREIDAKKLIIILEKESDQIYKKINDSNRIGELKELSNSLYINNSLFALVGIYLGNSIDSDDNTINKLVVV